MPAPSAIPAPTLSVQEIVAAPAYTPAPPLAFATGKTRRLNFTGLLHGDVRFDMGTFPTADLDTTATFGVAFASVGTEETTPGSGLYRRPGMAIALLAYCRRQSVVDSGTRYFGMRYGFVCLAGTEYDWAVNSVPPRFYPSVYEALVSTPGSGIIGKEYTLFSGWYTSGTYPAPLGARLRHALALPFTIWFDVAEVFDPNFDAAFNATGHFYEVLKEGGSFGVTVSGGDDLFLWDGSERPDIGDMLATDAFNDAEPGDTTTYELASDGDSPGTRTLATRLSAVRDAQVVENLPAGARLQFQVAVAGFWNPSLSTLTSFSASAELEYSEDGTTWEAIGDEDLAVDEITSALDVAYQVVTFTLPGTISAQYTRLVVYADAAGFFAPPAGPSIGLSIYLADWRLLPESMLLEEGEG